MNHAKLESTRKYPLASACSEKKTDPHNELTYNHQFKEPEELEYGGDP